MPSSGEVAFMTSQNVLSVSECCGCPQVSQRATTLFIKGDNPSAQTAIQTKLEGNGAGSAGSLGYGGSAR